MERSTDYWANKSPGVYVDAHLQSDALANIASDPEISRLSRAYFGCDYQMIECKLFITEINQPDSLTSAYHFDHCGVKSLNVIVYLNSVSEETGPHVLVARTHRQKRIRDYFREYTPIEEIERRFPEDIRTITGPPGTVLFENPEVFHGRLVAQRRRVAMIIVFSTNGRRLLSMGRDY